MRLSCPNCLTEYDIPDAALAGRSRSLRCARCGHQWRSGMPEVAALAAAPVMAMPVAPVTAPEPVPDVGPAAEPEPVTPRTFGVAVDEDARAEVETAAMSEGDAPLGVVAAETNTEAGLDLPSVALPDYTVKEPAPGEGQDGFAELFRAKRDKSVSYEPEPPPPPPLVRANSKKLLIGLVVLFVIGLIILERHAVMQVLPFTKGMFHGLGLG